MIKRILFYVIASLLFGGITYYLSVNIIISCAVVVLYFMFFMLIFEKKYKEYDVIIRKTKECISFINNFIITLSINNSVTSTFDCLQKSFSAELVEQINAINHLNDEEKIMYLENYFQSPLYIAFTKLLKQFLYNGGNIIDISHLLIFDSRIVEENLDNYLAISKRKLFQFATMWAMCFIILIVVHISLGNYYSYIQHMTYFPYAILIFFVVFLACFYFVISHYFNLKFINEEIKNEKSKK